MAKGYIPLKNNFKFHLVTWSVIFKKVFTSVFQIFLPKLKYNIQLLKKYNNSSC